MSHSAPAQVIHRLEQIDTDLAEKMNEYEDAADQRARAVRDWEHRFAICMKVAQGTNEASRKAHAFVAAVEQDNGKLFGELKDAEARYDALKAVTRVLETRATIGQSILRAQGRS